MPDNNNNNKEEAALNQAHVWIVVQVWSSRLNWVLAVALIASFVAFEDSRARNFSIILGILAMLTLAKIREVSTFQAVRYLHQSGLDDQSQG